MSEKKIPKAFISYSHDSQEHKQWVLDFATRLLNSGVDAIVDFWSLEPGDDLPHFMEQNLSTADRVLMVCTENYVKKANSGTGGVGYEKMIVTAEMFKNISSNKFIPLIRQNGTQDTPTFLGSKYFLDFSLEDQFEFPFEALLRTLHNAPLFVKPPISNNPFTPVSETPVDRTGDGVLVVMKAVVEAYESKPTNAYIDYLDILHKADISRVMLDIYLAEAVKLELISQASTYVVRLEPKGRVYAVQHKLVS